MRTKTLLLTAALSAAGALTSMAQVYSVNIVGYVNLDLHTGFNLIANQLNASPDNTLTTLFHPPTSITVYKLNASATGYDQDSYDAGAAAWDNGGTMALSPGQGAFVQTGAPFTQTFVGEVQLVSSIPIVSGFQIVSSVIPQTGTLDSLSYPAGNDTVYQLKPDGTSYAQDSYDPGAGAWDSGTGPTVKVGEGFFVNRTGATSNWARNFSVGP